MTKKIDRKLNGEDIIEKEFGDFLENGGEIGGPVITNRVERVIPTNTIEHGYGFGISIKSVDKSDKLELILGNNANKKGLYPVQRMYLGTPEFAFEEIWAGDFLKGENGYTKLPNGFILQWGTGWATTDAINPHYNPFPIVFPNACLTVSCTGLTGSGSNYVAVVASSIWGVTVRSSANGHNFYWMAIGY